MHRGLYSDMDFLELGCACLQFHFLKPFMDAVGLLGRGLTAPAIGLGLLALGYCRKRPALKRTGWAVLISLAISALLINLLKIFLQSPRPTPRSGYGFPSGDSGTVFSLATVIGVAFPTLAPLSMLLASLASISRLYFRAHYVLDIFGGAGIGIICGKTVASRMLPDHRRSWFCSWPARLFWSGTVLLIISSAIFFFQLERKIAEHRLPDTIKRGAPAAVVIDLGTPAAKPYLLEGWSTDKLWRDPPLTINWVEGWNASLAVSLKPDHDWRLRLRAYPYRPQGFVCQWADVSVGGRSLGRIYLEQDWNTYELRLPGSWVAMGKNNIDFRFPYADTFNWHGINPAHKPLSVAFDFLEIRADYPPH
jgi:membrane-associated phospholipid phosphatase